MGAQLALHPVEGAAVLDARTRGEAALRARMLLRLVAHHHDAAHALRAHLPEIRAGSRGPSTGCPPVIATASL